MVTQTDRFGLTEVLGLRRQLVATVLNGRLHKLERVPGPCEGPERAVIFGVHRRVEPAEQTSELLLRRLRSGKNPLAPYVARLNQPTNTPAVTKHAASRHRQLQFVVGRLIPVLRRLGNPEMDRSELLTDVMAHDPSPEFPTPVAALSAHLAAADPVGRALGGDVVILGQNAFGLTWMPGHRCPKDCFVQVEGECYSLEADRRRHLMTLEGAFRRSVEEAVDRCLLELRGRKPDASADKLRRLADSVQPGETVYRDGERSVRSGTGGSLYCWQRVPPFAVEAPDGKLRQYEEAEIGVHLKTLTPEVVLPVGGPEIGCHYPHPYVFDLGGQSRLCMGHDVAYFQRFWNMPLEEGIVEYLNAARLVLCAGHFEGGGEPLVDNGASERPRIGLREARKRRLPVYRYFRK
ncbi:MAG: hypothetical protein QGI83_06985 [Candidatus Latescibacteria bacterium]|nr:hypothetical protein [Candidatus Latescibacterota bacterium]